MTVNVKQLGDGQLQSSTSDMYTVPTGVQTIVNGLTLVNTHTSAITVNIYVLPNGGTARRICPKDLSIAAGALAVIIEGENITLDSGDKVQGDASTTDKVDYILSGVDTTGGTATSSFTGHTDTPSAITANKALVGNSGATAIEFADSDPDSHVSRHETGGADAIDHGSIDGLADDDHTQYVKHALSTAASDFLVGSGSNTFIKKTLAETGAILEADLDHGNLQGLADDDHTQYIKDSEFTQDSGILVGTGAGTFQEETGATLRTSIGVAIGTDVLAQQTIGIADNNLVEIDDADAADNDYAKLTANGLEGRSYSEVVSDLQTNLSKINDTTDQDTLVECEEDAVTMDVAGVEAFNLQSAGILTLAKQSSIVVYLSSADQYIPTNSVTKMRFDAETEDIQSEFDNSEIAGTADATEANKLHDADGGFSASNVGDTVYNTADNTYTTVSGYVDSGELDLTDDIMVNGETYIIFRSKFTATVGGKYSIVLSSMFLSLADGDNCLTYIYKNGAQIARYQVAVGAAASPIFQNSAQVPLAANDYIEAYCWHNHGSDIALNNSNAGTSLHIVKLT